MPSSRVNIGDDKLLFRHLCCALPFASQKILISVGLRLWNLCTYDI